MPPGTLTLTDFLLARISEDEDRVAAFEARAVLWPHEEHDAGECDECDHRRGHRAADDRLTDRLEAECEAKRRIVEWCGECGRVWMPQSGTSSEAARPQDFVRGALIRPEESVALRMLALPYADHPDYRDEWRA